MAVLALIGAVYALWATTPGAKFVTDVSLSSYLSEEQLRIDDISGNFKERVVYSDIEIKNLPYLPEGTLFKVKELSLSVTSLDWDGVTMLLEQARIFLPLSDPLFVQGRILYGVLDFNIYASYITLRDVQSFSPQNRYLKSLDGDFQDIDIYVSNKILEPFIKGEIRIEKLTNDTIQLLKSKLDFILELKDVTTPKPLLYGVVKVNEGTLSARKTAVLQLEDSSIRFEGDMENPSLNVRGRSVVDGVKIRVHCSGTLQKPELSFSSTPPLPEQQLLVMLATGKAWTGATADLTSGQITTETAKDFLDYFLLGGAGGRLAETLGIKEFKVIFEKETKGLGVTKSLSDNVDASYTVEQSKESLGEETLTQKIGGELHLNEKVSVGAEREILDERYPDRETAGDVEKRDTFFMKFETNF